MKIKIIIKRHKNDDEIKKGNEYGGVEIIVDVKNGDVGEHRNEVKEGVTWTLKASGKKDSLNSGIEWYRWYVGIH